MSVSIQNARTEKIASAQSAVGTGRRHAAKEDIFDYSAFCPVCGRRVFDLSDIPRTPFRVRLKCPHCRKIVRIPFSGNAGA